MINSALNVSSTNSTVSIGALLTGGVVVVLDPELAEESAGVSGVEF